MKIAIVTGHFMPELGYQEVYLARAYSRLGHCVKVFTSVKVSPIGRKILHNDYQPGVFADRTYNYEILRLKTFFSFRSKVISLGLKKKVTAFHPDIILVIGVSKLFPVSLLNPGIKRAINPGMKIISFFSDAEEYIDRSSFYKKILAAFHTMRFYWIKRGYYCKAVRFCDHLVLNMPKTETIFRKYLKKRSDIDLFNAKKINLSLGFDPGEFYFNEANREEIREKSGILEDECAIITSTRVEKKKNLEKVIDIISTLKEKGIKVHYIIIGFLGDHYEKELKKYISRQQYPDIFHCYPFMDHISLNKYYCSADLGIWRMMAISITEAMGTGLPVILEDKSSVNNLVYEHINGWLFKKGSLEKTLQEAVTYLSLMPVDQRLQKRYEIEKFNHGKFSYDVIAGEIVRKLNIKSD
jgi:glycosyltransferase involved in cell wall biosynthesis